MPKIKNDTAGVIYYPVALNLSDRLAVVVGGGKVAQRKVQGLLKCGARIRLISPTLTSYLRRLVSQGRLIWIRRNAVKEDLAATQIIITATDDASVNQRVSGWARKRGVRINVVDDSSLSDFISPAVLRKNKAIIAVYTDGRDPVLSRDLKNFLKENWDAFLSYRNRP